MDVSRPVIFWSELDGLRHQETLGVAMAWKWKIGTEVTPRAPNIMKSAQCRQVRRHAEV